MTGDNTHDRPTIAQPRIAEMVAAILRARIVNGDLSDGDLLPKQDDLIVEFGVSRPSIREAMRILETEALVSVRRGNMGGSRVHAPKASGAAHMLGLVMQSQRVSLADVATALRFLEPACASLAAERVDRALEVVPKLKRLNEEAEGNIEDGPNFTRLAREWHSAMVTASGNQTLVILVGTLEGIWAHHESVWADYIVSQGKYPELKSRHLVLQAHIKITNAIEEGDEELANRSTHRHLDETQTYLLTPDPSSLINMTGPTQRFGSHR